ncbi:hypothetical protein PHYBOEH_000350 [Phytophthora boehmeriae]|uniref:Uncharacterized protein n=1 Tax=Phytophthora boehmeriae TaxID=109152 RepID=A0A8T1WXU5_9STRA|nr:hypothetical protein PHYBOEH_000350 [Phytophthora boehmeriae]
MTLTTVRPEAHVDAAASSIFERLFKHKEDADNPQEDEEPVPAKEDKEDEQKLATPIIQPTLLADLHALQLCTQQLQAATQKTASNNHDDDDEGTQPIPATAETENIAALYCRRAAALLAFVDHDATTTVPLDILASRPFSDEANQPQPMLEAVQQALQDAQAAAALTLNNATLAEAHLLAAQCSRSLGELSHARAFTALAAAAMPGNTAITNLAEQLDVEAHTSEAGPRPSSGLKMTSAVLAGVVAASVQLGRTHHDEDEDNNDQNQTSGKSAPTSPSSDTTPAEQDTFWRQIATRFQVLEEAAQSNWLEKFERTVHQNVHHNCALPVEVRQLDTALQNALAMLALLLQSSHACSVLGLNRADDNFVRTLEKLGQAATSSPQTLVQNRTARQWIVHAWAPAVHLAASTPSDTDPSLRHFDSRSILIDLSHDLLLMLSRLLQASGSWRGCTAMAHSLAYTEMGHDLAKRVRSDDTDPASWSRLELQCAEARATALLQRSSGHEEALRIFRESLQAAIENGDQEYELRARLHITKTLRRMGKLEIAHAELEQLLARSRALNDVHVEAMAQYELGEHFVRREDLETAQEHFKAAQTLCNRTANCGNSWRPRSIQQAIAFYSRLQPTTRRGAMRCSVSTLLQAIDEEHDDDGNTLEGEEEEQQSDGPKQRRQAFCFKNESPTHHSLMNTVIGSANDTPSIKPKRTMNWRESTLATMWPELTAASNSNKEAE